MKKFLLVIATLLTYHFSLLTFTSVVSAVSSTPPFAPFSVEGNPEPGYYIENLFPLMKYINPAVFEVYENKDIKRDYLHLKVCGTDQNEPSKGPSIFDQRDYECDEGDACDGGWVDWCTMDGSPQSGANSGSNACNLTTTTNPTTGETVVKGHCRYAKRPHVDGEVEGTDFADPEGLSYPKLQSESLAKVNVGSNDNPITYGSHYLMLDTNEQYLNQLLVLTRANQSKATHTQTGEWPLGWVDWGYVTKNGRTLLDIYSGLPAELQSLGQAFADQQDQFLLNIFDDNFKTTSVDVGPALDLIKRSLALSPPPAWATDFLQSPIYPPSYRQGYAHGSICVFDICCPWGRCKVEPTGEKDALYYDTSISQAYNAAITEFFLNHSLDEGRIVFRKLAKDFQLVRFLSSAAVEATPLKIQARLEQDIKGTCTEKVPWGNWHGFAVHMDYLKPGGFLDKEKQCPDTTIGYDLTKETALAGHTSAIQALIDFFWTIVDNTVPTTYHLITVPDAMGQVIEELQQPVYDSRDTLAELEKVKEHNASVSNVVLNGLDNYLGGKKNNPYDAQRRFGYYSCTDDMFSTGPLTSVEAYALGTRIGCDAKPEVPEGKCDGQLFAKLIEGSGYEKSSQKGEEYFNSNIKTRLTAELMNTYAAAEKETGVPCEILAGIHFVEADNNPQGSLVSGRTIGTPEPDAGGKVFQSLLETATYAGEHLKGKVGGNLSDAATVITALSRYNGGGNSNCQSGYPYPIPYGGCPKAFEGEDDPYPTSFLDTKHDTMYLLYCADYTACAPAVFERPGSFTVALNVYNSMTKGGYTNAGLPQTQPQKPTTPGTPGTPGGGASGFTPKSCGPESLSTALGCIPYTRDAFVSALLTFIVGIAGAIALMIMLIATIQIMTAAGDPKKLQAGRELFTSAVIGLLFLIFSVSLLRLIAGDIIKLPGF